VLAAFILLLACINFTNLATARASERAREVGVRKSLGARRRQLAVQFLGESMLASAFSLVLASILCKLALPWFNALAEKSLTLETLYAGPRGLAPLGLTMLVGVLAGSYPALVLSRFQPVSVLKGSAVHGGGERSRKSLVVFQFAVSIGLIAATAIVLAQFRYMSDAELGFDPRDVLVVKQIDYLDDRADVFKQELGRLPGVRSATAAFSVPGTRLLNQPWRSGAPDGETQGGLDYSLVDAEYAETLGMALAAGRLPSQAIAGDATAVLLNETAARDYFGWSAEEAVGKSLIPPWEGDMYTVVGVTKDVHFRSLHWGIRPIALVLPDAVPDYARLSARYIAARVEPDETAELLAAVQALWRRFSDLPFQFSWLADDFAAQYGAEQRLAGIFAAFSALAVLIACLGLFGLAAFAADSRRKEIGVRKVLGAGRARLLGMLSADFLVLVGIAFVIAAPVTHFTMQRWLDGFAYRTEPGIDVFLAAGAATAVIAMATVSYQVARASRTNPVKALRYE